MTGSNTMLLNLATVQTAIDYWLNHAILKDGVTVKDVTWRPTENVFKVELVSDGTVEERE